MAADPQRSAREAVLDEDPLLSQGGGAGRVAWRRWPTAALALALAALGCAAVLLPASSSRPLPRSGALGAPAVKAELEGCAKDYAGGCANSSGCCNSEMTCFVQNDTHSECRYLCKKDGHQPGDSSAASKWKCDIGTGKKSAWKAPTDKPSLYCYLFMSPGPWSQEPQLVKAQLATQSGIFSCNKFSVFAEKRWVIGAGPWGPVETHATGVVPQGWDRRKKIRTNFIRVWKAMRTMNHYQWHHYTIKIDPDTVFLAERLRWRLNSLHKDPLSYAFRVGNCKELDSTQGVIEIMSKAAAHKFLWSVDHCAHGFNLAFGEDWFAMRCWTEIGIAKLPLFSVMHDKYCSRTKATCREDVAAYHPFKSAKAYSECVRVAREG